VFGGKDQDFAEQVEKVLRAASIEAKTVKNPLYYIWKKQAFGGAIKPTAALTRLTNGEIVADEDISILIKELVRETTAVANSQGYSIDADVVYRDLCSALQDSTHKSSMLQDVEAEKKNRNRRLQWRGC
jgi:ketopantoate reductase